MPGHRAYDACVIPVDAVPGLASATLAADWGDVPTWIGGSSAEGRTRARAQVDNPDRRRGEWGHRLARRLTVAGRHGRRYGRVRSRDTTSDDRSNTRASTSVGSSSACPDGVGCSWCRCCGWWEQLRAAGRSETLTETKFAAPGNLNGKWRNLVPAPANSARWTGRTAAACSERPADRRAQAPH